MLDFSRYIRQTELIGQSGQEQLQQARVLCVGAGGLGTLVSSYLAAAGVGNISLIDEDKIELSNLTRQITYTESQCGQSKVEVLKKFLNNLNSGIQIHSYADVLKQDNVDQLIRQHDMVLDCSDNFKTRYLLSDACSAELTPLISASVDGFMGQVMILQGDLCYRCVFPENKEQVNSCYSGEVIGTSVAVIASMQANEALKFILNIERSSRIIQVNNLSNQSSIFNIYPDSECINEHTAATEAISHVQYIKLNDVISNQKYQDMQIIDLRGQNARNITQAYRVIHLSMNQAHSVTKYINKTQQITVVCNHGIKSKLFALQLLRLGYKCVYYTSFTLI